MRGLSEKELQDLILSVGRGATSRRRLSPVEVAQLFHKALKAGVSLSEIATTVRLTTTMVSRFTNLLKLDRSIIHDVGFRGDGSIVFSSAFEIAKLSSQDQEVLANAALENNLTKEEVKQIVQL